MARVAAKPTPIPTPFLSPLLNGILPSPYVNIDCYVMPSIYSAFKHNINIYVNITNNLSQI